MGKPKAVYLKAAHEDLISNESENTVFSDVLEKGMSRRDLLRKAGVGMGILGAAMIPGMGAATTLTAKFGTSAASAGGRVDLARLLRFEAVPFSTEDTIIVPKGYKARAFYSWGDAVGLNGNMPEFKFDGSNSADDQLAQAGMHHDGMAYFPIGDHKAGSKNGLLAMNHEYIDNGLLFTDGDQNWSLEKVRKGQNAMGVSVVEVSKSGGDWQVVRPSKYARRITPHTPMKISGPAKGHTLMRTLDDPSGEVILGTMQNCANGQTPWGTYLTCEENWSDIFVKKGDRTALEKRYGISDKDEVYRWNEFDKRFDANETPNEPNRFGWVVEIDPFDPTSTPVKHTALGRFKHEGAEMVVAENGQVAVYMGDDQKFEYIYKFVSNGTYDPKKGTDNSALLSDGTLYVARFNDDGSGEWLPMIQGQNGLTAANGFRDQGDVLINARGAADVLGATKMDRPEWISANPHQQGSIYCTLTNNSDRGEAGYPGVDAANPRANNLFGHIIHWLEQGGDVTGTAFSWNILALAGRDQADNRNHVANHRGDLFGSPDGLKFDHNGLLWVQTDVSTSTLNQKVYKGMGNNQMLVVDPNEGYFKRFLTGPSGAEVTGIAFTPDNKTMFINIQHPGEPPSGNADAKNPSQYSNWPDHRQGGRPRSATVVIEREDGDIIGL